MGAHPPAHQGHELKHDHDSDVDWGAVADSLETDGVLALPLVEAVVAGLVASGVEPARVAHVVDAGCGPGVVTCALAGHLPAAAVTGLDSADPLLVRLRLRAVASGLDQRVAAIEADLERDLPALDPADLVWASMVVHHMTDPAATLERLRGLLRPGGRLVMIEFAGSAAVLPDDDPLVARGAWQRLEQAAMGSVVRRLGFDVINHDWPAALTRAGFVDVADQVVGFRHDAPLDELGRRWLMRHVRRGIRMAADALAAGDAAALEAFAAAVEAGERTDPFIAAERRVLVARRPVPAAP